jgi:hypothetical protein
MMDTASSRAVGDRKALLVLALGVAFGAVLGYFLYQQLSTPYVRPRVLDPLVVDLQDLARQNRLRLEAPPGATVEDYLQTKSFTIGGDTRQVLYMHPTSSATFHGRLPDQLLLEFSVGLDPGVWDKPGDGVEFQVEVRDGAEATTAFVAYLDPKRNLADRRWVDASVDLSRWAFREIDLVLRTLPGASTEYDWAGWSELRLVYAEP